MSNDAGQLAGTLEDLHGQLTRWSRAASDTIKGAEMLQRHALEFL